MTATVCSQPGCPELVERGGRCPAHYLSSRSGRQMPKDWKRTRARILRRDQHRCHYCGAKATSADHLVAIANGGSNDDTNLVACCWPCNQRKGNRDASVLLAL